MSKPNVDGQAHFFRPAINSMNRRPGHQPTRHAFRARLCRPIPAGIRHAPDVSARCVLCLIMSTSGDDTDSGAGGPTKGAIRQRARPSIVSRPCPPFLSRRHVLCSMLPKM